MRSVIGRKEKAEESIETFQSVSSASFPSGSGSGTISCEVTIRRYGNLYFMNGMISCGNYTKGTGSPGFQFSTNLRPKANLTLTRAVLFGNVASNFAFNELGWITIGTNGVVTVTKNWNLVGHSNGLLQAWIPDVAFTM